MAALTQLAPGMVFANDFRVLRPLAEGGMGAVYVVEQASTGKKRALKVMHPQFVQSAKGRERFTQEARIGAQIESDHVVDVVSAGVDEATGTPWLAMELLEGEALDGLITRRGRLSPGEALEVLDQLSDALAKAHARGIVHRDLKPENLFIATPRRRGVPFTLKVLDFGIAKLLQESQTAATGTGVLGSPLWMAPEQAMTDARIRPATDVWALGLIAFHLLTGRYYWLAANAAQFNLMALLMEVASGPLPPASQRAAELGVGGMLPPGFDGWFAACVTRAAEARFQDAGAAFAALQPVLAAAAPRALPPTQGAPWAPPVVAPTQAPAGPFPATPYPMTQAPVVHTAPPVTGPAHTTGGAAGGRPAWLLPLGAGAALAGVLAIGVALRPWASSPRAAEPMTTTPAVAPPTTEANPLPGPTPVAPTPVAPTPIARAPEPAQSVTPTPTPAPTPAPVATPQPVAQPTQPRRRPHTTASRETARAVAPQPAAAGAPMDDARACRGDNACVVRALRGRARTEQELALLASTYRAQGDRGNAQRTMRQYLQRYPNGPRANSFRSYVDAESGGNRRGGSYGGGGYGGVPSNPY